MAKKLTKKEHDQPRYKVVLEYEKEFKDDWRKILNSILIKIKKSK